MCTAGTFPQIAARTDTRCGSSAWASAPSLTTAQPTVLNTIHCSSDVGGSAAQFNQSVSAMPAYVPGHSHPLLQGTADTLSKGWTAVHTMRTFTIIAVVGLLACLGFSAGAATNEVKTADLKRVLALFGKVADAKHPIVGEDGG